MPKRSRIEELEKKFEALENQSFAQKLLIDELENKVEELKKQVAIPFIPYYQPPQIQVTPACLHNWGPADMLGNCQCTLCGTQFISTQFISTFTFTCDNTSIKIQDCTWSLGVTNTTEEEDA